MILFLSRYGAVRSVADHLASQTGHIAYDIRHDARSAHEALRAEPAARVAVLGAIYAGSLSPRLKRFLDYHQDALIERPIALGLSCLYQGEEAHRQLTKAYPTWLLARSEREVVFGGAVTMEKLGFAVRALIQRILGGPDDVNTLDWEEVGKLADWLKEDLD